MKKRNKKSSHFKFEFHEGENSKIFDDLEKILRKNNIENDLKPKKNGK